MASLLSSRPIVRSKTSKRARVGSNLCPRCETPITDDQQYLPCCVRELSFCIKCNGISKHLAEAIQEDTTNNFKWTCNVCKQNFPCMSSLSVQLKTTEETTHNRLSLMEKKMQNMDENINSKIHTLFQDLRPGMLQDIKDEIKESLKMMLELKFGKLRTNDLEF